MFNVRDGLMKPLWSNGPTPGGFYNFPGTKSENPECSDQYLNFGSQRSSQPITTGTSVIGIQFDRGVMIAADNLVSYGSLARFQDVQRVFKVNDTTIMGTGGDYADFQCVKRYIDQKHMEDICHDDSIAMEPNSLFNWLTRMFYNRRCRFDPLWVEIVVGGIQDGEPFLGHVDYRGRAYKDKVVATGFGKHFALPLVRERLIQKEELNQQDASELLRKTMEVLFYRDCRASPKYTVAVCTVDGVVVQGPINVNQNWQLASFVKGY